MNKAVKTKAKRAGNGMLAEYRFDYRKAKPNRFAARLKGSRLVLLDADVAERFPTTESVNRVLRALIAAMPKTNQT